MRLKVGMSDSITRTITNNDVSLIADIVGDYNPIHMDENYAKKSIFKRRVVHGCLINGLISTVIGMKLPGEGTIYMEQNSKFCSPVFIGDTIKAVVEVDEILNLEKGIYKLKTKVFNQNQMIVLNGYAIVKFKE